MELMKPGAKIAPQQTRVTFRIVGEKQPRLFDATVHFRTLSEAEQQAFGKPSALLQSFVDYRCRAFVRLNGYNPVTKEYTDYKIIQAEVDYFYCDHPLSTGRN